jgi:riboflavin kinase/FMN adenylyltransferase
MKIVRCLKSLSQRYPYPVLTIGAFDGIHLGHQAIIRRVRERAREKRGTSMLFTFSDHPLRALDPGHAPLLLTPPEIKQEILREMGLDLLIWVPFTQEVSEMEPRAFVEEVLVRTLGIKEIWVGFDFAFGRDRRGDICLMQELGRELNFLVEVIPPVALQGRMISSTLIRNLLGTGKVAEASLLLGRPYMIRGVVVKGRGQGKELGFPTANLKPPKDFLLPDGVYAGWANQGGQVYQVAINVGRTPTFPDRDRRIEVHFLGFEGDLYRRQIEIHFLERVREERQFPNQAELAQAIREDAAQVAQLLSGHAQSG